MKKILFLLCLNLITSCMASNYPGKTMSLEEAEKNWGHQILSIKEFKSKKNIRKKMAVDVLKKQTYVGQNYKKVYEDLGRWDGFFITDNVPAYILEKNKQGTWQLIFDYDTSGTITKVFIQKNGSETEKL